MIYWSNIPSFVFGFIAPGAPKTSPGVTGWRVTLTSEGHAHENGRNSETKSRKIDPKVPNRPSSRGLQTGQIRGPIAKNGFSGQNPARWLENGLPSGRTATYWGPGVNFFPNIGKWGIQSGATICPDHTALFRSIKNSGKPSSSCLPSQLLPFLLLVRLLRQDLPFVASSPLKWNTSIGAFRSGHICFFLVQN